MRVLIPGIDGYIGWSLAQHLLARGDTVAGFDNLARRKNVAEMGSHSAIPILEFEERCRMLAEEYGDRVHAVRKGDMCDYDFVDGMVSGFEPDAVVHLAEQPSAPYSMIDHSHNTYTQHNNVIGTLNLLHSIREHAPRAHLVKLGTMGEYGYDTGMDIPEGFFEMEFRGKRARVPYPRMAGSWYHWTKVHDSNNIMFACKLWGIRSTDIMQGIVYGTRTDQMKDKRHATRFDFDEAFGTALNRFCAQAVIGHPLTVHGKGGQTRGFLALNDSLQCMTLLLDNPPDQGQYRVVNQFDEQYSVLELANKVARIGGDMGLDVAIKSKNNPRRESESHYYKADHDILLSLGFRATRRIDDEIRIMLQDLVTHRDRILEKRDVIVKNIAWDKK